MLGTIGVPSLAALIDQIVPADIRASKPLDAAPAESEAGYHRRLRTIAAKNRVFRSYIGLGYHDTLTPPAIARNVFENPGWYTPYTPYQAEIAQGRLESLLNFQTMVSDLTGMEVANASLLDEATAAAEAVTLLLRVQRRTGPPVCVVSDRVYPHVLAVLQSRTEPLGITLRVEDVNHAAFTPDVFGVYVQTPDDRGEVHDFRALIERAHAAGAFVAVGTDLLALTVMTPPGEMGADVVVGNAQRFGVPLGYGGPHAAFFATREKFLRQAPGRVIGVSVDAHGRRAYRMALQTREQHIRREKATSNICTAQALLANMSAFYAVYHGPEGLRDIGARVHDQAMRLAAAAVALGYAQTNGAFFDTPRFEADVATVAAVRTAAEARGINLRYPSDASVQVSVNETVTEEDLSDVVAVLAEAKRGTVSLAAPGQTVGLPASLRRTSAYLQHPVFNTHHSEPEMMRYIRGLERKDIGLDTAMIPLGSCTMKLNAATEMLPVTWEHFGRLHPFAPADQAEGYAEVFRDLEAALREITGFAAVSLQPNSGAQGEFAGLMVIRAYHRERGDTHRDVVLIPASAHGTNPASAAMAGMRVVVVATAPTGDVDIEDLKRKAVEHGERLACLMITYPSTHGVFE